jgi:major vault protein
MSDKILFLNRFQFAHVIDKNSGVQTLHEGPKRVQLDSHEEPVGPVSDKVRVKDGQFAVILNPFDHERGDINEGEREVRVGPAIFPLHPGEVLEGKGVQDEFVLIDSQALLLKAKKDAPHPEDEGATLRSGDLFLLRGPRRFIPDKDIEVVEHRKQFSLDEHEGVFVQNDDTGEVRLIRGPASFFLDHNESLWEKKLTAEEEEALGFIAQNTDDGSRILAAEPHEREAESDAVVIDLEQNEAICLFDKESVRVEFGPQTVFLNPTERPKVLCISGGVPVKPNRLRIAILALGPDFIRDRLSVRTRDNATLQLEVTFRWRFRVDVANPQKLFALKDFVGFAAQTLSSEIREEAAKHDFEKFHSEAAALVKGAIFGQETVRLFEENGLEIFGVDVEGIVPEDAEIAKKLADAIKVNVDIFTRRVQEVAQLESERRIIDGKAQNEEAKKALIALEIANERTKTLEAAKTKAEASLEKARAEAEGTTILAEADRSAELTRIEALTQLLATPGGQAFIELERAKVLKATDKVVVPTDSKLVLGIARTALDD